MKVVILAGGYGTRLSEQTDIKPKPMVEIGGYPILWHIMRHYAHYGFKDFVIALGYKAEIIKDYFLNYHALSSDFTINLTNGKKSIHSNYVLDWNVTLVDTGIDTMTGGRLLNLKKYLKNEPFFLTYGDGVSNINIAEQRRFHKSHGKMATITAVHPKAHYGELGILDNQVQSFMEKPKFKQSWINGGFFIFESKFIELISDSSTILEREPLEAVTQMGELMAFKHKGFWQCMDTLRDNKYLNKLWQTNQAEWKVW